MPHSFNISILCDLSSILKEAENSIVKNGGMFKGDTRSGEFAGKTILGKIKGEYARISDDEVEITIVKKPFAAPNGKIESAIREYFS
ncbi:MAG: hypothetical protein DRR42_16380 [Gammaproteobacteria bacterium]|nr:MAG: hypothetical protein DRR42_16380 [Gammaproteobacteria bacterium]